MSDWNTDPWERKAQAWGWGFFWLLCLIITGGIAWASYDECTRVHPSWYCIAH